MMNLEKIISECEKNSIPIIKLSFLTFRKLRILPVLNRDTLNILNRKENKFQLG